MTMTIPDECKPGAPMREHFVRPEHLREMQEIASVSAGDTDKPRWTELGLYYRPGYNRPFVAVVHGKSRVPGETDRFQFMAAGTLDRAAGWFEGSNLRDMLTQAIPVDAPLRFPSADDARAAAAVKSALTDAIEDGVLGGIDNVLMGGVLNTGGSFSIERNIGITTDRLTDALEWLYPETSLAGKATKLERDFGMPARTTRRALQIENGNAVGEQGSWVPMFLASMRYFDREHWRAGQATIASVGR